LIPHSLRSFSALTMAAAIFLCFGCSAKDQAPAPTAVPIQQEDAVTTFEPEVSNEGLNSFGERYTVDSALTISDKQISAASDSGPILQILSGGELTASGILLDRTAGAAAADLPAKLQASVVSEQGAKAHISVSAVSSDANQIPLFSALGGIIELQDTMAVSAGTNAAALYAEGSGSITANRCDLFAGGENGNVLFAAAGGTIVCAQGTRISASIDGSSTAIRLADGGNIQLSDAEVSGDIFVLGYGNALRCTNTSISGNLRFDTAEDEVDLQLRSGSRFLGTTDGDGAIGIRITLDAASRWILTGDAYVAALSDEDPSLSNIDSGGFSLYYNAESEENLWLGGKSMALSGGGYLIPLI